MSNPHFIDIAVSAAHHDYSRGYSGIYLHTSASMFKPYIGQSTGIFNRLKNHRRNVASGRAAKKVQSFYDEHGDFVGGPLYVLLPHYIKSRTKDEIARWIDAVEFDLIAEYESIGNGLNTSWGGQRTTCGCEVHFERSVIVWKKRKPRWSRRNGFVRLQELLNTPRIRARIVAAKIDLCVSVNWEEPCSLLEAMDRAAVPGDITEAWVRRFVERLKRDELFSLPGRDRKGWSFATGSILAQWRSTNRSAQTTAMSPA